MNKELSRYGERGACLEYLYKRLHCKRGAGDERLDVSYDLWRDDGVDGGPKLLPYWLKLVCCHEELQDLRERKVPFLVACKRVEAPCPELVDLVEWTDVHGQGIYGVVHALHVWDGDWVVGQCSGHVLRNERMEVLAVVEVMALSPGRRGFSKTSRAKLPNLASAKQNLLPHPISAKKICCLTGFQQNKICCLTGFQQNKSNQAA